MKLRAPFRNESGSAAIEFAIAVPVLVMIMWGIFQIGMIFEANAGMQHALGEAARYATVCEPSVATPPCGPPSDTAIQAKITSHKFGLNRGTWGTPTIDNTNLASGYKVITVTYSQPMDFLFFSGPTVSLSKSKRVYVSDAT